MASNLKLINELYQETIEKVTSSGEEWLSFLNCSSKNYKYTFHEQLLIYAQKPDAVACAEFDIWTKDLKRRIKKDSKGIALLAENNGYPRLRYVFDISDTYSIAKKRVYLWRYEDKYKVELIDSLNSKYNIAEKNISVFNLFNLITKKLIDENYSSYFQELINNKDNTRLEYIDNEDINKIFNDLFSKSIIYSVLNRCNLNTFGYFTEEDFDEIKKFVDIENITMLGSCVSEISKIILNDIAVSLNEIKIKKLNEKRIYTFADKKSKVYNDVNKGRNDYNENNLYQNRELSNSKSNSKQNERDTNREVWNYETKLFEGKQESSISNFIDDQQINGTFDNDTGRSRERDGYIDLSNGTAREDNREVETTKSNEMGRNDEQYPNESRRNRNARIDIQLEKFSGQKEGLLFLVDEKYNQILCNTTFLKKTNGEIINYFNKENDINKRAEYLKSIFNDDYSGVLVDNKMYGYKKYDDGLLCWNGNYLTRECESFKTWEELTYHYDSMILLHQLGNNGIDSKITDEFVNKFLMNTYLERKIDIYDNFKDNYSLKDKATYLKNLYGIGGCSSTIKGSGIGYDTDSKGIRFYRGYSENRLESVLNWNNIADRITSLINANFYLNSEEKEKYNNWLENKNSKIEYEDYSENSKNIENDIDDFTYLKQNKIKEVEDIAIKINEVFRDTDLTNYENNYNGMSEEEIIDNIYNSLFNSSELNEIIIYLENCLLEVDDEYSKNITLLLNDIDNVFPPNEYQKGDKLEFGRDRYEITSIDDDSVLLYDYQYPLFVKEYTREEFDELIKEYPNNQKSRTLNLEKKLGEIDILFDALLKHNITDMNIYYENNILVAEDDINRWEGKEFYDFLFNELFNYNEDGKVELLNDDTFQALEKYRNKYENEFIDNQNIIGKEITIGDRNFTVDKIDNDEVSLKDIALSNSGYPIFKVEKLKKVKELLTKKEKDIQPKILQKRKSRLFSFDIHPEISDEDRLNYRIDNNNLGVGTTKQKYFRNIEAITILKKCEEENRFANKEEQDKLAEYVGWGGLPQFFDDNKSELEKEYHELKNLLTEEEYSQARASTLTAFYTPPIVVKTIYQVLQNLGFKNGNILEPSCGVGNFLGLLPETLNKSKLYGIEVDSISGRIARQLYQKSEIIINGYEKTELPDNFFDVSIGNVPFGREKIDDKKYNRNSFFIHDYFFAKTIDKVRPGGIIAFITSKGTLDKEDTSVRRYISQRADLLGAIRLPNDTFKDNAGTTVTSDIIFLQKRGSITDIVPDWIYVDTNEDGIKMNKYFIENPNMILGKMEKVSTQYGCGFECLPLDNTDLEAQLDCVIENIKGTIKEYVIDDLREQEDLSIEADYNVRNFSYTIVNNQIYYRQNSKMYPVEIPIKDVDRIKKLIELRECVRNLIYYQSEDFDDSVIKEEQATLNRLYDNFSRKYGYINSKENKKIFSDDSSYYLLCSLEVFNEKKKFIGKADIFSKRTIRPNIVVNEAENSTDALILSISEKAKVDMDYMMMLTGKSEEELVEELKGQIFLIPHLENEERQYVPADEYLSGDVKEKLKIARAFAMNDPKYNINVKYLEENQPKEVKTSEISVRLGTTWIPTTDIDSFMYELLDCNDYIQKYVKVRYSNYTSEWNISNKKLGNNDVNANKTYGTKRANAYELIEDALNLRDTKIFDYEFDEQGKKIPILNVRETAIAQSKQDLIRDKFKDWIWKDIDRRERLTKIYNDNFNNIKERVYDGSHIKFIGMNSEIELSEHQKNAVAKVLYGGNTLLAHCVGAGKTFEMVASAMESKRIGLCTKSLFIVPKSIKEQIASDFMRLYPSSNILVAYEEDFKPENRKVFCSKVATGDYDAVIMGHSQFKKIPMSLERQRYYLEKELNDIIGAIKEEKENGGRNSFTVKQLEAKRKQINKRLEKLHDGVKKDDVINFEELGIDKLFVDEAHYFKNLYFYTKMWNVAGIAQSASQMSSDLFDKVQYLNEITDNRGVVFATGTPVSNSMVEIYTMQRYLQYHELEKRNIINFDAWASTFGETVTAIELAPDGTGYRAKTRFARFYNLPELMSMFRMVADIKVKEDLNLKLPKVEHIKVLAEPSEFQLQYMKLVSQRAEKIRKGEVDPKQDNMLKITSDCKKMSLDPRIDNGLLEDFEGSKVNICVEKIYDFWKKYEDIRATQLVFCDLSTPKSITDAPYEMEFVNGKYQLKDYPFTDVYTDIKRKLISKGIPKEEIVFIHEANTDEKRKQLFAKVRKGVVRVLLGSTSKMGEGVNVQERVIALHRLDCPWKPSQVEQQIGRGERRGNINEKIFEHSYATKKTFDSFLYQTLENKQRFISQIMTSKTSARTMEDIDDVTLSYAEMKALSADNPDMIRKTELDMEVSKLQLLKQNYLNQLFELQNLNKNYYPTEIERLEKLLSKITDDRESLKNYSSEFSPMKIKDNVYVDKEKAGQALLDACRGTSNLNKNLIGEYKGFDIFLKYEPFFKLYYLYLERESSYKIELGTGIYGNLTRIENFLSNGILKKIEEVKNNLENTKIQFSKSIVEAEKSFDKEEELKEKSKELNKLNIKLSLDKKDKVILNDNSNSELEPVSSKDYER